MKNHTVSCLAALLLALPAYAQKANMPAPIRPSDISPPIPIVKEVVNGIVNEQRAIILTPKQINDLKETTSAARKESVSPYPNNFIAKPVFRKIDLDDDSSQGPKMIRLSAGTITTLEFTDSNGNPWLVSDVSLDCSLFDDGYCLQGKRPTTNIVKIQAKAQYAYGNIVIQLEEKGSSASFMLSTGQSTENDIKVSVRVSGRNPNAKPQAITLDRLPDHDPAMGYFLDGVAPQGAVKVTVNGGKADAWILNGSLYLRTRMSLLSPAFMNKVGNADGVSVYRYYTIIPQILASSNGKTTSLYISGY